MKLRGVFYFCPTVPSFKGVGILGAWKCRYYGVTDAPQPPEVKSDGLHIDISRPIRPGAFCNPAKLAVAAVRERFTEAT